MQSDVLYHFVGCGQPKNDEANFEVLCKILRAGHVGRYPDDDPTVGVRLIIDADRGLRKGELISQSITCFCDIPFDNLELHTTKYGRFGLGISRSQLCLFGARPVSYVPRPSSRPDNWGIP